MFNFIKKLKTKLQLSNESGGLPSTTFATQSLSRFSHYSKNNAMGKKHTNRESGAGFTMIELIITIAVLSFGIVSSYAAFASIIGVAENSSERFTAIYLAQEGLEITRNIRDKNFVQQAPWSAGLLSCSAGCQADYKTQTSSESLANQLQLYQNTFLKITADGLYGYDAGTNTKFKRQITITQPSGPDILKATSEVTWDYNGKPYTYQTSEYLYNWK